MKEINKKRIIGLLVLLAAVLFFYGGKQAIILENQNKELCYKNCEECYSYNWKGYTCINPKLFTYECKGTTIKVLDLETGVYNYYCELD